MSNARTQHDTRHLDMAVQEAQLDELTREARNREYCIHCHRSVDSEEYDWKYTGIGGFLTGPFCGKDCQLADLWGDADE